eukprot:CAMPEP_0179003436 /NCGR_PEP_ID=MMETSP0795-20121207/12684_1 /TAXON_ID=88552 /ORGANISM="Amoebophrya sp., Strain Ameob2" /LENGTH=363 /DNA_ID=CAMNT_0020697459 /DNA_START=6 /DNA_END=1097 /DNA_ORIENTATION=+
MKMFFHKTRFSTPAVLFAAVGNTTLSLLWAEVGVASARGGMRGRADGRGEAGELVVEDPEVPVAPMAQEQPAAMDQEPKEPSNSPLTSDLTIDEEGRGGDGADLSASIGSPGTDAASFFEQEEYRRGAGEQLRAKMSLGNAAAAAGYDPPLREGQRSKSLAERIADGFKRGGMPGDQRDEDGDIEAPEEDPSAAGERNSAFRGVTKYIGVDPLQYLRFKCNIRADGTGCGELVETTYGKMVKCKAVGERCYDFSDDDPSGKDPGFCVMYWGHHSSWEPEIQCEPTSRVLKTDHKSRHDPAHAGAYAMQQTVYAAAKLSDADRVADMSAARKMAYLKAGVSEELLGMKKGTTKGLTDLGMAGFR